MSALVSHKDFTAAIAFAKRAAERRSTVPILSNVLIRSEKGGLVIETTDMDRTIIIGMSAEHVKDEHRGPLTLCIPIHNIENILKKTGDAEDVKLEKHEKTNAVLTAGDLRATLMGLDEQDWPATEKYNIEHTFAMEIAPLAAALVRIKHCISTEEHRYYLNGVYMHVAKAPYARQPHLRLTATDGHRLGIAELPLPSGAEKLEGIIIPAAIVTDIIDCAKRKSAPTVCSFEIGTQLKSTLPRLIFTHGNLAIHAKGIDGTFPDYTRVIPTGNDKIAICDREKLARIVDKVQVMQSERGRAVKLSMAGSSITASVTNYDSGTAKATIGAELKPVPIEDDKHNRTAPWVLDIGFNSAYFLDLLAHLESETVEIKMSDPGSPTLFAGIGDADKGIQFCLMPMRV